MSPETDVILVDKIGIFEGGIGAEGVDDVVAGKVGAIGFAIGKVVTAEINFENNNTLSSDRADVRVIVFESAVVGWRNVSVDKNYGRVAARGRIELGYGKEAVDSEVVGLVTG